MIMRREISFRVDRREEGRSDRISIIRYDGTIGFFVVRAIGRLSPPNRRARKCKSNARSGSSPNLPIDPKDPRWRSHSFAVKNV